MSSLLAQQLEAHRAQNVLPAPADAKKSRPTILFKGKANMLDARQVLDLGRNGLQKLCAVDNKFKRFQTDLFGTAIGSDPRSERHLLPPSEREMVDQLCRELLLDLSAHLNEEPAQQVLEYLLQRFNVHITQTEALLSAALPYHETPLFTIITQLPAMPLAKTKWAFLSKIKLDERGITRARLVKAMAKELALFDEICKSCATLYPNLFAALVLETFQTMVQNAASAKQTESHIQVAVRHSLDCLKVNDEKNVIAACVVFSSAARHAPFSADAAESLLMVLARKLNHIEVKKRSELQSVRLDLAGCLLQVYEWQFIGGVGLNLFTENERWNKFEGYILPVLDDLIEAEGAHVSRLITDITVRALGSEDVDVRVAIASKGQSLIRDESVLLEDRVKSFTRAIVERVIANTDKKKRKGHDASYRPLVDAIAEKHANVFIQFVATLSPEDRVLVSAGLFKDEDDPLAIRLLPAESDLNLPLALRDGRINVRLAALRHLQSHRSKAPSVLFVDPSNDPGLIIIENFLGEPVVSRDADMVKEFEALLDIFAGIRDELNADVVESVQSLLRRALTSDAQCRSTNSIAAALVKALAHPQNDANMLSLASVFANSDIADRKICTDAISNVNKTWLQGATEDASASAKSIAKSLKKESVETIEQRIVSLAPVAPRIALALSEEMMAAFPAKAPIWALDVLETAPSSTTIQVSSPKAFAMALLKEMDLTSFLDRVLASGNHVWQRVLPLVGEALHATDRQVAQRVIENSLLPMIISKDAREDVRLIRALRLYRALLVASQNGNTAATLPPTSAKKSKANSAAGKIADWTTLLPLLSYAGSAHVRAEAMLCLQSLPGPVSDKLLARKNEIERDPTAAIRALRSDVSVKQILEQQTLKAISEDSFTIAFTALECSGEAKVAKQVILMCVDSNQDVNGELLRLVSLAFKFITEGDVDSGFVRTACLKGLARFPVPTLNWLLVLPLKSIPGEAAVLDALVDAALGRGLPSSVDAAVISDVAERSGRLLVRVHFKIEDITSRLLDSLDSIKQNAKKGAGKKKQEESASESEAALQANSDDVRRLCVLLDVAGSLASHIKANAAWDVCSLLFDVLKVASARGLALLEQTVLSALERIISASAKSFDENKRDLLSEKLLLGAQQASNLATRMSAIRILERLQPTLKGFEHAFRTIDDAKSLERIVDTLCNLVGPQSITRESTIVAALCEAVQRVQPANRINLLKSFASRCESPAEVLSHWMRLTGSETDCSAIAGQFNAHVQTDLMIQLVDEGEQGGIAFVAKHLASRTYMKALVEKEDADISQFIELFEKILRKGLEVNSLDDEVEGVKELRSLIERAMDGITVLLSVPVFVPVISETLTNEEPLLRGLALRALKTKVEDEHQEWSKEETRFVLEFAQQIVSWFEEGEMKESEHTLVLALNILAQYLSAKHKDVFAKAVPTLVSMFDQEDEDEEEEELSEEAVLLASALCLCIGTICKNVTTHCLASLPLIIPRLEEHAFTKPSTGSASTAEVLRQAAIAAMKDIVDSGVALGSSLDTVVDVALNPDADAAELLESLGSTVEPRLGLTTCSRVIKMTSSIGKGGNTDFGRLARLLSMFVDRMTAAEAITQLKDLKDIATGTLLRAKNEDPRRFDASAIVKMGLLLSEKRLREFVEDLLQTTEDNSECLGIFMEILRSFLEKCGSLFLPVLPFDFILGVLKQEAQVLTNEDQPSKSRSSSKRSKQDTSGTLVTLEMSLLCVAECLEHAMNSGYVDIDKFDQLLPPLVMVLRACPLSFTSQFLEPCFATLALATLSNSQANAMLQTLHHAVTRLLRSDSVQVRQAALSCVKTLFERVGNDYLVLMPDTLPFLAELLEDRDSTVRSLAQKLALVLKDLSGEDISEFLK